MTNRSIEKLGKVLIVDDLPENLNLLMQVLKETGMDVAVASSGQRALDSVERINPDVILLDVMMPQMNGYEVCMALKDNPNTADIPVLYISAQDRIEGKLNAFAAGGVDYISKPFTPEEVLARVQTHLRLRKAQKDLEYERDCLRREIEQREKAERELYHVQERFAGLLQGAELKNPKAFSDILTESTRVQDLFYYIEALARSGEPVLITGESGTGKELFSRAVYQTSCAPDAPFVAVNSAGFDDAMFSDTLFGHVRGAYTGAEADRPGMVEKANGGVLFLDEIGDLSQTSQVKLLRLLQEGEYLPLGCDQPRTMNARVVVATNADLPDKIKNGTFRQDLYYRLAAHHIALPALRERTEDLKLLLDYFLAQAAQTMGKTVPSYPQELIVLLKNYSFPGNIRELRAMVFDAMSKHTKGMLSMKSFEQLVIASQTGVEPVVRDGEGTQIFFSDKLPTLKECQDHLVIEALQRTENNQAMAARMLGVTPGALSTRIKKLREQ